MELSEEDRPPRKIWDDPEALKDWFDRLKSPTTETGIKITLEDVES